MEATERNTREFPAKNSFAELGLRHELIAALDELKIQTPTAIQSKAIPTFLAGRSFFALGQTGTGKTCAYALPLCQLIKTQEEQEGIGQGPYAVIVVPTKELAVQVVKVFKSLTHHLKLKVRPLGGERASIGQVLRENPDIIVTVPGVLTSLAGHKHLFRFIIIDEADQVLEPCFKEELSAFFAKQSHPLLQIVFFSATLHPDHRERGQQYTGKNISEFIQDGSAHRTQIQIKTFNIELLEAEKIDLIPHFMKREGSGKGVIFINKKEVAKSLFEKIESAVTGREFFLLHGDLDHKTRKQAIKAFRSSQNGVVVATDILARGMHFPGLEWVLNYDLPFEASYYLHRVGRVGREGEIGRAYNFITPRDQALIARINESIKSQNALPLDFLRIKKMKVTPPRSGSRPERKRAGFASEKRPKLTRGPGNIKRNALKRKRRS
ncbi:MAG: DEAD/DEAH box helicase [Bdellovibrio sp.]|nr:DEAD/DEAH box helicase [Bdellovibrio sp.]